jgi:phosphoserine aminotransferase
MKGLALQVPSVLSWKVMDEHDNLYNTQCTFAIWAMKMVTDKLIAQGGLEANARKVETRAQRVTFYSLTP